MFKTRTIKKSIGLVRIVIFLMAVGFLQPSCELISPNKPPFAEVQQPLGDVVLRIGETQNFSINAYDVDGQIIEVQFLMNGVILFIDDSEPYNFSFTAAETLAMGLHKLSISAIDNDDSFYTISKDIEIKAFGEVSAGEDMIFTNGQSSYTLDALLPEGGIGVWTTVPTGLGSFSDVNDPNAVFTAPLCETYQLKWIVSQGEYIASDEVTITFLHTASAALAGEDVHYSDNRNSVILDASIPEEGQGKWIILVGEDGVLDDSEDPKTSFTGKPCTDYFLEWSISTACETHKDTLFIRFDQVGAQAVAGPDQIFNDGTVSTILQGNDPGPFTALWEVVSGVNGSFVDASDPNTIFNGSACETYVLKYSIISGCGFSEDPVTIAFNHSPSAAQAGADMIFYDGRTSTFLDANFPAVGEGQWTIVSGTGGQIDDNTDNGSRFIGMACESYVLSWTITASCGTSSDEVLLTFGDLSTEALAGSDQFITNGVLTTTMAGNTPTHGQGVWSIVVGNGGSFSNVNDPQAQFTGQLCGSYVLQWKISSQCAESLDQVSIQFDQVEIPAYAGPDLNYFDGTTSVSLNANDPQTSTGIWQIMSGEYGSFSDVNNPNATFIGQLGQVYVLKWSISSSCGSTSDKVKIAFLSTGSFYDNRDGSTYPTVTIGGQVWMTENLNYKTVNYSWSYNSEAYYRQEYGLLYAYEAASIACPSGWHLPSDTEWRKLEKSLGMTEGTTLMFGFRGETEGAELKETGLLHWQSPNNNAVDLIGFKALPAGYRDKDGNFGLLGSMGAYWTATQEVVAKRAIYRGLHKDKSKIGRDWFDNQNAISVRCIKD